MGLDLKKSTPTHLLFRPLFSMPSQIIISKSPNPAASYPPLSPPLSLSRPHTPPCPASGLAGSLLRTLAQPAGVRRSTIAAIATAKCVSQEKGGRRLLLPLAGLARSMELHKYWCVGGRRCGNCEVAPAAVYCRTCASGSSFLCTTCDARPAHARLAHERVWVCEVCELAPAAVTCKADAAVLCAACDADIHDANPLARRHARVPVAPIGSEAAAAAVEAMLFGTGDAAEADDQHNNAAAAAAAAEQHQHQHHAHHAHALNLNVEAKDMKLDYLFSELDPYLSVEIPRFHHADSVVPNGAGAAGAVELDFTCGIGVKHSSYSSYTATSLDLAHSGSSSEVGVVPEAFGGGGSFELDFTRPKPQAYMPYTATPQSHSVSSVDVEVVPERGDLPAVRPVPLMGESREARLMRYREKRKNRRFEKTIRYASRKAYAETRPRIKGRFAKRADHDGDGDADDAEAEAAVPSSYVLDFGYGVVPSF